MKPKENIYGMNFIQELGTVVNLHILIQKISITVKYGLVIFILLSLSCNPNNVLSQACGTVVTEEQEAFVEKHLKEMNAFNGAMTRGIRDFPLKIHIIRRSDGTGGMSLFNLKTAINDLNKFYINANIRFVILDNIHYIDDDEYYDFDTEYEEDICGRYDEANVINLYFFNSIRTGINTLCGYAYFPKGHDRVLMTNTCAMNGSTLPHEFGHYFMLYHTHGRSNTGATDELIDQSNCTVAGDKVCDTPADPNLSGKVDKDCSYTGKERDKNGIPYAPDTYNMMSYAPKKCRQKFTKGQFARVNYTALHHRSYLRFPPARPSEEVGTEPNISLSGELILEVSGRRINTTLDGNLYKSTKGYYSGTTYNLSIINNEPAYVYVLGSNKHKRINLLFPLEKQSALLSDKGQRVALPGGNYRFQMDDTKGQDYLMVIYSKKPLTIDSVMRKMKFEEGNFLQRLYKVLGEEVVPLDNIKYSEDGRLQFSAIARNHTIVPIVVEIEHL